MSNLGSFVSRATASGSQLRSEAIQDGLVGVDDRGEQFVVHARLRTPSPERLRLRVTDHVMPGDNRGHRNMSLTRDERHRIMPTRFARWVSKVYRLRLPAYCPTMSPQRPQALPRSRYRTRLSLKTASMMILIVAYG
jgi:hypothetical protein